jgi:hypothetical protein
MARHLLNIESDGFLAVGSNAAALPLKIVAGRERLVPPRRLGAGRGRLWKIEDCDDFWRRLGSYNMRAESGPLSFSVRLAS